MTRERLQKYLARCGVASRRSSERLIAAGRVRVNARVLDQLGATIDPDEDAVEVDGRPVRPPAASCYVMLHKPAGVVTTARDPRGRPTVVQLVSVDRRLYPVGRLDYDSEGLVLLMDDGELAARLTHPRHEIDKEYRVLVRGRPDSTVLRQLARGVELDGRRTAPAIFEAVEAGPGGTWLRVVLREGRNRQIRRMAALVGLDVIRLVRVRIGPLRLGNLAPGAWRELTPAEVAALRDEAALREESG